MWILMQQNSCRHPIQEAFLMLSWKRSFLFCSSWAMQSFSHVIVESSSGQTLSKKCPMPWSPVTFRFQSSFSVTVSHDNPNAYSNNTLSWISRFIFTNMNINALWLKDHYTIYTYCLAEDTNISVPSRRNRWPFPIPAPWSWVVVPWPPLHRWNQPKSVTPIRSTHMSNTSQTNGSLRDGILFLANCLIGHN